MALMAQSSFRRACISGIKMVSSGIGTINDSIKEAKATPHSICLELTNREPSCLNFFK